MLEPTTRWRVGAWRGSLPRRLTEGRCWQRSAPGCGPWSSRGETQQPLVLCGGWKSPQPAAQNSGVGSSSLSTGWIWIMSVGCVRAKPPYRDLFEAGSWTSRTSSAGTCSSMNGRPEAMIGTINPKAARRGARRRLQLRMASTGASEPADTTAEKVKRLPAMRCDRHESVRCESMPSGQECTRVSPAATLPPEHAQWKLVCVRRHGHGKTTARGPL